MTVEELIKKLSKENPKAIVYTTDSREHIAFIVTEIHKNIIKGPGETVTLS